MSTAFAPYNSYSADFYNWLSANTFRLLWDNSATGGEVARVSDCSVTNGIWSFAWPATGSQKFFFNYANKISSADNTLALGNYYPFFGSARGVAGSNTIDWARARKYVATEPSFSSAGAEEDSIPPTATFSPLNGATDIAVGSNITITFNETVRKLDDSALTDANVDSLITLKATDASGADIPFDATIDGDKKVITINPTNDFSSEQVVYITIGATVEDSSNNAITASNATFTIADVSAPTVSTLSPANNTTGVSTTTNLVITFNEAVNTEAGADNDIVIKTTTGNTTVETIDAQDAKVTGDGTATITINPATVSPAFLIPPAGALPLQAEAPLQQQIIPHAQMKLLEVSPISTR